jgi:hypothetical protein
MAAKRMTGKDYKKELQELNRQIKSLEVKVNARLYELTTKYPDVDLPTSRAGGLKCSNIAHIWIIEETTLSAKIEYIETIEKYLTEQHPHKQTEIEFPKTQHEKIMKIAKDVNNLNIPKSKK